ncbi:hypothetical protein LEP1GSC133_1478 [Leptospira borgpetersenii serovar Pomona str. 200901868]|uniref:Uncharacterized protein n=1 Tax=Leptospira borgpetersenii serovar Pomona str. 200901868 TaxID=1192866 RepID=M6W7G1_LEPBO|nr:hypothetical protein LEP1GSC133_1478 [Leptospira borgpetersenii serovar Pomona str. 200901868]
MRFYQNALFVPIGSGLEHVPKPFDFIGILADRCNCSYVLGQTLNFTRECLNQTRFVYRERFSSSDCNRVLIFDWSWGVSFRIELFKFVQNPEGIKKHNSFLKF